MSKIVIATHVEYPFRKPIRLIRHMLRESGARTVLDQDLTRIENASVQAHLTHARGEINKGFDTGPKLKLSDDQCPEMTTKRIIEAPSMINRSSRD